MTKTRVKKIGVASLAAFTGIILWGVALFTSWPVIFLEGVIPGAGISLYLFAVIGSLVWGLIVGVVVAVLYNFIAMFMGGIVLELEETK